MPISNFEGETFVAFLDISGFKEMMKGDKNDDKNTKKKSRKNAKPKR